MDRLDTDQREALKNLILIASFGLSPDWPRGKKFALGLGLASVLLTWPRKCATNANNIGCIHSISWLYHCNIHYKDVVKHSNVGQKKSVMCCWYYRHVFLFRNIYMWPASDSALSSAFWPCLTSLAASRTSDETYTLFMNRLKNLWTFTCGVENVIISRNWST